MILLDSSFVIAYHNARDVHHPAAAPAMRDLVAGVWGHALLLEYVFLEVVTVLLARRGLATASTVGTFLMQAREVEFVPCSQIFHDTLSTFRSQRGPTKSLLSFTDAAIVTVARQRDASFLATFDSDFESIESISVVPGS